VIKYLLHFVNSKKSVLCIVYTYLSTADLKNEKDKVGSWW